MSVARILHLRSIPVLRDVAPVHLAAVAEHAQEQVFRAGSAIVRPDVAPGAVHLVVTGRVGVSHSGRPAPDAGPGDMVGFTHLLARATAGLDARAIDDTHTLRLDWATLLDIWEDHFPVLLAAIRFLGYRTLDALRRLPSGTRFDRADPATPAPDRPLDLVERLLSLRDSANFPDDTLDALAELAHHVEEVRLREGDVAWQRGAAADEFLLVHAGAIRAGAGGGPFHTFVLGPGRTAGMQEALSGHRRWYDAVVERPVTALRIAREPFIDILEDHFDLGIGCTAGMARRLLELMEASGTSAP